MGGTNCTSPPPQVSDQHGVKVAVDKHAQASNPFITMTVKPNAEPADAPKLQHRQVFISYSHDSPAHRDLVLALSERLRKDGINTLLDRYIEGSPLQGWPRWMLDQLDAADSVLVVCTETYYRRFRGHEAPAVGRGVDWEGALITQEIYDSRSRSLKFVPVFLSAPDARWVPEPLRAVSHYAPTSEAGYQSLYDFLLRQSAVLPGALGQPQIKPRPQGQALAFGVPGVETPAPGIALPETPAPGGIRMKLIAAAALLLIVAGLAWTLLRPPAATPSPLPGPATAQATAPAVGQPTRLDVDVAFEPHALMQDFGPPSGLELVLDVPEQTGPFGFKAGSGLHFLHHKFQFPAAGSSVGGTLQRVMQSAHSVTAQNVRAINTHVCLSVTSAAAPTDGVLRLACSEANACVPADPAGIVVACGSTPVRKARWLGPAWLPSAVAQPVVANTAGPAPGDWLVPRLDTLQAQRGTPQAVAYSEVKLVIDAPQGAALADAASYEVKINGHRLWVNGMAAWTHAVPLLPPQQPQQPLTLRFGLENLDAAGQHQGREQLDIRLLLLRNHKTIAEDSLRLDFTALRDQPEAVVQSAAGRTVRWSARYWLAKADRYQLLAYGGGQRDSIAAKAKFDDAKVPDPASKLQPLVGVIRPPTPRNPAWGLAVGAQQPNGQVRFSFEGPAVMALCTAVQQATAASALRRNGFKPPATFLVREIATEQDDDKPKPLVECSKFSAS